MQSLESLQEEVSFLTTSVRDLRAQNFLLSVEIAQHKGVVVQKCKGVAFK